MESKNYFNEAKRLIDDIRIDMNKVNVSKEDKNFFNDLDRLITDISNNRVRKENAVERLNKSISNLTQLREKQSTDFQNKMIQVVYQLFNSFGFNKEFEPLFSEKESDQLQLPNYVKLSHDRFYKIKNNIDNNKGLATKIKDKSGKVIIIDTKYAANLMNLILKNKVKYDEAKRIFNDNIIESISSINFEKPSSNRTKLLRVFLDLREVFTGKVYRIKVDDKYDIIKLKNNAADKKSKLETQNESVELDKEKKTKFEDSIAERTKLRKQKSDKQPDTTDIPELESEESAEHTRNQQGKGLKVLTPNQMLSRLPISLAQLKAGNNSQKLKNEIRQIFCSLYR